MRVLVIPEDPTLDQYILKPIVERLFADLGRTARVEVLRKPHLRGVDQALDSTTIRSILLDRPMFQMFLLVVDRDCVEDRAAAVAALEQAHPGKLVGCLALEEVEVWMLALHRERIGERWPAVREHCHPKEAFADPLLVREGWNTGLGRGRVRAMEALAGNWNSLLSVCPELAALRERLRAQLA